LVESIKAKLSSHSEQYLSAMKSFFILVTLLTSLFALGQSHTMKVSTPGISPMFLTYLYKGVPEELALSAKQVKELNYIMVEVGAESKNGRPSLQAHGVDSYDPYDERVLKLLLPAQQVRLEQIWIQKVGLAVLSKPKYQKELALTTVQVTKIKDIIAASQNEVNLVIAKEAVNEDGKVMVPPSTIEKIRVIRVEAQKAVNKELIPSQIAKWKGLNGAPFKTT
jgi:hypothetical protein